jgi:hypothetical protein
MIDAMKDELKEEETQEEMVSQGCSNHPQVSCLLLCTVQRCYR